MSISTALAVLAVLAAVVTAVQTILTIGFRRRGRPFAGSLREQAFRRDGFISILKPVCGLDHELEENLLSFVGLDGLQYEVILSVEDRNDPAMPVLLTAVRDHPDVFRLVVGQPRGAGGVVNRKVDRLIDAARVARGDIFFISDSNVRVSADDLQRTLVAFDDPRTGCVSNLFVGSHGRSLGAAVESLHLLAFVVPGTASAAVAGVPCVVGKSMAISRRVHDAIGGFASFRTILAEDQAIGLAVREAGYRVEVSPVVVRNVIGQRSVGRAMDRQVRWNKIRYSFNRALYAAEILTNPLPLALLAAAAGATALLPAAILVLRVIQLQILARATGAAVRVEAIPMLDAVMFAAWFVPFFSNSIEWRGYRARIGRNTEMTEALAR
jgi:ceramide glucosyltransferase